MRHGPESPATENQPPPSEPDDKVGNWGWAGEFAETKSSNERLDLIDNVMAHDDRDAFEAIKAGWLDRHPLRRLPPMAVGLEADSRPDNWSEIDEVEVDENSPADQEKLRLGYADRLFAARDRAENQHFTSPVHREVAVAELVDFAKQQQQESLQAVDGYILAGLAGRGLLEPNQVDGLVDLAGHDQETLIVGRHRLFDRLLKANSFDRAGLHDLLAQNQIGYDPNQPEQLTANERLNWPSLFTEIAISHRKRPDHLQPGGTGERQTNGSEGYVAPAEIEKLANDLDLTDFGRQVFFSAQPIIHDLASPEMSLGLELGEAFFDSYVKKSASEQRQLLRKLDQSLRSPVLHHLAEFDQNSGWYWRPPHHQINVVVHPFRADGETLTIAGHELLHAADYHTDFSDDSYQLVRETAAYAQASGLTKDGQGLVWDESGIPVQVARGVAASTNRNNRHFDRGGGGSELHFWQMSNRLVPTEDAILIAPGHEKEVERFLSEVIAYAGTEVAELPPKLETHCRRIFKDRRKLVEQTRSTKYIDVKPEIYDFRQQLEDSRQAIRKTRERSSGIATPDDYLLAANEVADQCRRLAALRQQLGDQAATLSWPKDRDQIDQLRCLDNQAQITIRRSLEYIYDINADTGENRAATFEAAWSVDRPEATGHNRG